LVTAVAVTQETDSASRNQKRKMMRKLLIPLLQVLLVWGLPAAEFPLLKDGKAVSQMIVAEDAPLPVQYAARELAKYLAASVGFSPAKKASTFSRARQSRYRSRTFCATPISNAGRWN
jgi:hypothetical protein